LAEKDGKDKEKDETVLAQ